MEKTYDLGMTAKHCCSDDGESKIIYPSLYLSDIEEMPELPMGEDVEVKAILRLVRHAENEDEEEGESESCTIEVRSITVDTKLNMVDHAIGTSLEQEIMKMLKKKYPDMETEED